MGTFVQNVQIPTMLLFEILKLFICNFIYVHYSEIYGDSSKTRFRW